MIETQRLSLRPWTAADLPEFIRAANSKGLKRFPMKQYFSLLVFLLLLPTAVPVQAQVIFYDGALIRKGTVQALLMCRDNQIYSSQDKNTPSIVADSFAKQDRPIVFRTCRDLEQNDHYYFRVTYPKLDGVCRVLDHEVFPGSSNDEYMAPLGSRNIFTIKGWKAWPPDEWTLKHYTRAENVLGFVSSGDCPLGNDPRYMLLVNVTDGMLKSFQQTWDRVTASPEVLTKTFSDVPTASGFLGKIDTKPSQALHDRLRDAVFVKHEKLSTIQCRVEGCAAALGSVWVDFDVGPSGIVFTMVRPIIVS
jgi:hypothetical protein